MYIYIYTCVCSDECAICLSVYVVVFLGDRPGDPGVDPARPSFDKFGVCKQLMCEM